MPELPEVESVRRSLEPHVVGRRVVAVDARRRGVITGDASPAGLLQGGRIERIDRLGKQLALVADDGRVVCVHLGMTGSLRYLAEANAPTEPHVHLAWRLAGGGTIGFRDPRRFGGVWTFPSLAELRRLRWDALGPDALAITPRQLHAALARKRTPLKAALLDQAVLAGLGNIYVDELLFACRLSPLRPACTLGADEVRRMVPAMRRLLQRAIRAGGSTLRDYVDGQGNAGGFQLRHQVYGRAGQPCRRCRTALLADTIAGRTTVHCPTCQHTPTARARRLSPKRDKRVPYSSP